MNDKINTILVAEDRKQILDAIVTLIMNAFGKHVEVITAQSVAQAKEIIEAGLADLFVLDLRFMDGSGMELVELIRKKYLDNLIIIQSINDDKDFRLEIYEQYDNIKYLTKETVFAKLIPLLRRGMDQLSSPTRNRIVIKRKRGDIFLDRREICFISRIEGKNDLEVTSWDFVKNDFKYQEINKMSLKYFKENHDPDNLFLFCERHRLVNREVISETNYAKDYIRIKFKGMKLDLSVGGSIRRAFREFWRRE